MSKTHWSKGSNLPPNHLIQQAGFSAGSVRAVRVKTLALTLALTTETPINRAFQTKSEGVRAKKEKKFFLEVASKQRDMCRELSAIGTKEPQYHLFAFIMKASVWANLLEEGQEKTISDQKRPESDQISDQIKMILELIKEKPQISRSEISHKMGLHESSVKRRLKMMVDKGIIQRIGSDKGGHWQISNN